VLGIAAEFSFVTWGTQVAVAQTGMQLADATALASLFVVGEVLGRLALSGGPAARIDLRRMLGATTVLAVLGGGVLWLAGLPVLAGVGMLVGGLGVSVMYPLTTRLAVAHTPHAPVKASARLTAASGVAIFTAPLVLGVIAGIAGVISAWAMLIGILVAALAVLALIPRPPVREPDAMAPPAPEVTVAVGGA
jgi:fucose permease